MDLIGTLAVMKQGANDTDTSAKRAPQGALERLRGSDFRARFRLRGDDLTQARRLGTEVIRTHARDLLGQRLAPARPTNDGRQTPWRGHPVFVAQHATATCCRSCLEKWHGVPKGQPMTEDQLDAAVTLIVTWLEDELRRQAEAAEVRPPGADDAQPGLFG